MFYVATLGQDRAILGFPFLQKFNPQINWMMGTIKGAQNIQIELESKEGTLIRIIQLQDKARGICGEPADGESLFCMIRKVSFAQQWAAEANDKSKCMMAGQVPEEYQRHWRVFELQTDASTFALGATLFQLDDHSKKHMVGAASQTLTETEQNYDVWDREFMGFIYGLLHWRHLLAGTTVPVQVFVDHANLTHYCHP